MKMIFTLLFAACSVVLQAQSTEYQKGFIISNEGDTTRGWVRLIEGEDMYKICTFKIAETASATEFSPGQIRGFRIDDERFVVSKSVPLDSVNHEVQFLEVLIEGRVTLYRSYLRFFIEKDSQMYELRIKKAGHSYEYFGQVINFNSSNKEYVGILNMALIDCGAITQLTNNVKLTENSLVRIVKKYHECLREDYFDPKESKQWVEVQVGVSLGQNTSSIKFDPLPLEAEHLEASFSKYKTTFWSATLDLRFPRMSNSLSVVSEIQFLDAEYEGNNSITTSSGMDNNHVLVRIKKMALPIGLRYDLTHGKLSPFVGAGFFAGFYSGITSIWTQESIKFGNSETTIMPAFELKSKDLGIWIAAGLSFNGNSRFGATARLRYESGNGIIPGDIRAGSKSNITNLQLSAGLSYQIY